MGVFRTLGAGIAAGLAGTAALNSATYLDMLVRARPASSTPEQSAKRLADAAGVRIPGNEGQRKNRISALGPLLGIGAGVATGVLLAAARGIGVRPNGVVGSVLAAVAAMAAGNAPMVLLKVTDPTKWTASEWASDAVPHLAYGVVADGVLRGLLPKD